MGTLIQEHFHWLSSASSQSNDVYLLSISVWLPFLLSPAPSSSLSPSHYHHRHRRSHHHHHHFRNLLDLRVTRCENMNPAAKAGAVGVWPRNHRMWKIKGSIQSTKGLSIMNKLTIILIWMKTIQDEYVCYCQQYCNRIPSNAKLFKSVLLSLLDISLSLYVSTFLPFSITFSFHMELCNVCIHTCTRTEHLNKFKRMRCHIHKCAQILILMWNGMAMKLFRI